MHTAILTAVGHIRLSAYTYIATAVTEVPSCTVQPCSSQALRNVVSLTVLAAASSSASPTSELVLSMSRGLIATVVLVTVLVGSATMYVALAYEACVPVATTDLPDTPLLREYPCGAPAARRLAYTLARCPWALLDMLMLRNHSAWVSLSLALSILEGSCVGLLVDRPTEQLTTALCYLARSIPYMGLLLAGWRQQGPAPGALAKHWLYRASLGWQVVHYVALPRPSPALEALFGMLSTAAVSVLAAWHVPHARELGASPVAHAMMHAALAAALAGHAAWGAWGGRRRAGAGHGQPQGLKELLGQKQVQTQRPQVLPGQEQEQKQQAQVQEEEKVQEQEQEQGEGLARGPCAAQAVESKRRVSFKEEGPLNLQEASPGAGGQAGQSAPGRCGGGEACMAAGSIPVSVKGILRRSEVVCGAMGGDRVEQPVTASQGLAATGTESGLALPRPASLPWTLQGASSPTAAAMRQQRSSCIGPRCIGSGLPLYVSRWRHRSLALKVPRYTPRDVPPGAERRVARAVREAGSAGRAGAGASGGQDAKAKGMAMREGCIQLVVDLVCREGGLVGPGLPDGRSDPSRHQKPQEEQHGEQVQEQGEQKQGQGQGEQEHAQWTGSSGQAGQVGTDQQMVGAVLRALQLPAEPGASGHQAGERGPETETETGQRGAGGSGEAASGHHPAGVTWQVVQDTSSPPAAPPGRSPRLCVRLAPQLLVLPLQPCQRAQGASEQGQAGWGCTQVSITTTLAAAAGVDVQLQHGLGLPTVWVRRGGRFLPVRVRQLQEVEEGQGAGGEEAAGGAGGAGGVGAATGVTVLEMQLVGQPPAAGVAMVDLVWPCGMWRCVPLLLTRQEALAAEVAPALGLPYGGVGVRQGQDELIMDLGIWEAAMDELQGGAQTATDASLLGCPLDTAELRVLGEDLVAYAEECGWGRTAAWVRQGLEQLQGREEDEGQQEREGQEQQQEAQDQEGQHVRKGFPMDAAHGGAAAAVGPLEDGLRRRAGVKSHAEGREEGGTAGSSAGAGPEGAARLVVEEEEHGGDTCRATEKRGGCEQHVSMRGGAGPASGGSNQLEQGFHLLETVCFLIHLATMDASQPVLAFISSVALGPGTLITASRLLLPHAAWARLVAWYRLPRYGFYLASKLVLLLPGAPMFSTDYLRGPPVVAFEGVMLPLCCTLPNIVALPVFLASGTAHLLLVFKLVSAMAAADSTAPSLFDKPALPRGVLVAVNLVALGLMCTAWRNSSSRGMAAATARARGKEREEEGGREGGRGA